MTDAFVLASGALTPLGAGEAALPPFVEGDSARVVVADDARLRIAGVARSAAARVEGAPSGPFAAREMLLRSLAECAGRLDGARPGWRGERVGLAVGTSCGGMPAFERVVEALMAGTCVEGAVAREASYGGPFAAAREALGVTPVRECSVLLACASSTLALGLAQMWLSIDACDVVFAGGYDVLTTFVASGFSALGAVTASVPKPFRAARDGLALGEGAAMAALVRADSARGARPLFVVAGFGVSNDAHHVTAPDPSGEGVTSAARQALERAGVGPAEVTLVGAHATATPQNDVAEARALGRIFAPSGARPVVHAFKGEVGHLLGAAGVVETLALGRALTLGMAPASAGQGGPLDPAFLDAGLELRAYNGRARPGAALKLSSAFGGANVALVLRPPPASAAEGRGAPGPAPRALPRPAVRGAIGVARAALSVEALASRVGVAPDRLTRTDDLTRLVIDAVADLAERVGRERVASSALIVGLDVATAPTNEVFFRRVLERGPRAAEPRRFPATSPNACAGETAIVFGMRGLAVAVGGLPGAASGAERLAVDWLTAGLAPSVVVVEATPPRSAASDALWPGGAAPGPGAAAALWGPG